MRQQNMAFSAKYEKFYGEGAQPLPDPSLSGEGIPPLPLPQRLRHLDPSHSKILDSGTPLTGA